MALQEAQNVVKDPQSVDGDPSIDVSAETSSRIVGGGGGEEASRSAVADTQNNGIGSGESSHFDAFAVAGDSKDNRNPPLESDPQVSFRLLLCRQ